MGDAGNSGVQAYVGFFQGLVIWPDPNPSLVHGTSSAFALFVRYTHKHSFLGNYQPTTPKSTLQLWTPFSIFPVQGDPWICLLSLKTRVGPTVLLVQFYREENQAGMGDQD